MSPPGLIARTPNAWSRVALPNPARPHPGVPAIEHNGALVAESAAGALRPGATTDAHDAPPGEGRPVEILAS